MKLESLKDTIFENVFKTDKSFVKHFHETYTVGVTHSGVFKSNVLGEVDYSYGHSTRIINPGEVHGGDSDAWQYTNFYPSVALMSDIYGQISGARNMPLFKEHIIEDAQLYSLLIRLFASVYQDTEAMIVESQLIETLSYLIQHYTDYAKPLDTAYHDTAIIKRSVEMIHDMLDSDLSLEVLASNVSLSKYHFLRIFKQQTSITPHQYILSARIQKATEQIIAGESIALASLNSGFSDQSHFTRHFKRIYGYTPHKIMQKRNIVLYK